MARLPIPGSDAGTWGDVLNQYLIQAHNADGSLRSDAVAAVIPDASGSTKGLVTLGSGATQAATGSHTHPASSETLNTANSGAAYTINIATGTVQDVTLTANCTFSFTGTASGAAYSLTLILRQDSTGGRTVTWPASVRWSSAGAPTLPTGANKISILSFMTVDGGTTWFGFMAGEDMS